VTLAPETLAPGRPPLRRHVRRPGSSPRPEGSTAARLVVVLTAAYVVAPRLVQTVTAPKHRSAVGSDDLPSSALAAATGTGLFLLLVLLCGAQVLTRLGRLPRDGHGRLVVALAPWVLVVLRDVAAGNAPQRTALLYPLLLVTVWFLQPRFADLAPLGLLVGALALLSLAMGALTPDLGLYRSVSGELVQPEKLLLPWGVLVGPMTNGNNLGQLLSLGLPAVLLLRGRWPLRLTALAIAGAVLVALLWTGSRSSMLASGGAVLIALTLVLLPRGLRVAVAGAALFAAAAAVVLLPLVVTAPSAFTNRGQIWALSLAAVESSPFTGHGSGYYGEVGRLVNPLPSTAYHGHNEFVQVLVTGGVAYLAVLGALVVVAAVRSIRLLRSGVLFGVAYLFTLFLSCTLEVSFGVVDRGFLLAVTALPLGWILFARLPAGSRSRT
jgi:O-antigen ligase